MPIGLLFGLAKSKLGIIIIAGVLIGLVWGIQQWRIKSRDVTIAQQKTVLAEMVAALEVSIGVNERANTTIRELTQAKEVSDIAHRDAAKALAEKKDKIVIKTRTIIKEIASVPAVDECPVSPALRAALNGLRREFEGQP